MRLFSLTLSSLCKLFFQVRQALLKFRCFPGANADRQEFFRGGQRNPLVGGIDQLPQSIGRRNHALDQPAGGTGRHLAAQRADAPTESGIGPAPRRGPLGHADRGRSIPKGLTGSHG
jgi:hypothetical protein